MISFRRSLIVNSGGNTFILSDANIVETEVVSCFKRVRVISKKQRIKRIPGPFSSYASMPQEFVLSPQEKLDVEGRTARRAFEEKSSLLGFGHPDTHSSLTTLAWCLRNRNKFAAAEDLFRSSYNTRKEYLITKDPLGLQRIIMNLMTVMADQNKTSEIDELRREAASLFKSNMDPQAAESLLKGLQGLQIYHNGERQKNATSIQYKSFDSNWRPWKEGGTIAATPREASSDKPEDLEDDSTTLGFKWQCSYPLCSEMFLTSQKLQAHRRIYHLETLLHSCGYCSRSFEMILDRDEHEKLHMFGHLKKTLSIKWRRRGKASERDIAKEVETEEDKEHYEEKKTRLARESIWNQNLQDPSNRELKFYCHICVTRLFLDYTLVNAHIQRLKVDWRFQCESCGERFPTQARRDKYVLWKDEALATPSPERHI